MICRIVALLGLSLLTLQAASDEPLKEEMSAQRTYFKWDSIGAAFDGKSIGRAYAKSGDSLFAFGGRNEFGEITSEVQILQRTSDGGYRRTQSDLSKPVAFAASTSYAGKVYLIGGLGPDGVTDRVLELSWENGVLKETLLPPFPEPIMLAGAGIHRSTVHHFLYGVSGVNSMDAVAASPRMYELKLSDLETGEAVWQRMEDMPFGGRVAPSVNETYNELVVLGGYTIDKDQVITPTSSTWGFARIPRDGHVKEGWEKRADFHRPIAYPAVSKTGQSHLTVVGGDAAGGKLSELLNGSKVVEPVAGVWAFHDPLDVWSKIGELSVPAYGGALLKIDEDSYLWLDAREKNKQVVASGTIDFLVSRKTMDWLDWLVIGAYFIIVGWIGYHFARRQKDAASFALGNRNVKWWASGISLMATGVSTISFMAIPALAACTGLATKGPILFMFVGILISAYITFPILRRLNITSTYEYIEQRFGVGLRLLGSFNSIVVQLMGRIGIVVMLPALAISTMTGIEPWISVLTMGLLTTIYSTAGGFEAVVWTDVVQGTLMIVGFCAIGIFSFASIQGGWDAFVQYGRELDRLNFFITEWDLRVPSVWFAVLGFILGTMAFASDQATAQRVLAIPMKDVRKIAFLGGAFSIGVAFLSAAVGMGLFGFFKSNPEFLNPIMKNDQIVPIFIVNKIPVGLSGLLLATLFAAAMSTVSSSVNVCAVLFGEDFYKRLRKNVSSKEEMRAMQVVSMLTGIIGTGMALWLLSMDLPTLWESFMRIMAFIGGGFGGIYILGMFTRRTHEVGAIIGVAVSFAAAYYFSVAQLDIHYGTLGLVITLSCVVSGYVSSLIIPWKRKNLTGLTVWDQVKERVTDDELLAQQ
ncbi:sodium:solute symporter family transporter [Rubellicoccus peritrichatus]|uniref:Sodium/solute symporter n=1 Tax=Rubellicoccus peritrichatus TaxID=3080537 RepID=A0AAQ3LDE2_9BACT|nr:sodium/solute symporter [Puniceicoccus sp. CR14]WOO42384.1 sodium/solute symporter [Puniceicoccus sp. CR14]